MIRIIATTLAILAGLALNAEPAEQVALSETTHTCITAKS